MVTSASTGIEYLVALLQLIVAKLSEIIRSPSESVSLMASELLKSLVNKYYLEGAGYPKTVNLKTLLRSS